MMFHYPPHNRYDVHERDVILYAPGKGGCKNLDLDRSWT